MRSCRGLVLSITLAGASCSLQQGGFGVAVGASDDAGVADGAGPATTDAAGDDGGDFDASRAEAGSSEDGASPEGSDGTVDAASDGARDAETDARADATADAGVPGTIATTTILGITADKVSPTDQGLTGDGKADGTFTVSVVGPVDGLALVTAGANGTTTAGHQWDTLVTNDAIPSAIGGNFTTGSQTVMLGVYEGTTRVNDANGRISLGAGLHALTLYGSNDGSMVNNQHFRVYARAGGVWQAGPNVKW